jgi:hypothetical protein
VYRLVPVTGRSESDEEATIDGSSIEAVLLPDMGDLNSLTLLPCFLPSTVHPVVLLTPNILALCLPIMFPATAGRTVDAWCPKRLSGATMHHHSTPCRTRRFHPLHLLHPHPGGVIVLARVSAGVDPILESAHFQNRVHQQSLQPQRSACASLVQPRATSRRMRRMHQVKYVHFISYEFSFV